MLRLGCFGCLSVLIMVALVAALGYGVVQAGRAPDFVGTPTTAADGQRAQQKIFEIVRRAGGGRPHTVTLSDREVNAFLSRHLADAAELPLRNIAVRLPGEGEADIAGQLPWRQILGVPPLSTLAGLVPAAWLERGAWLSIRARATLESHGPRDRKQLRLDVQRFSIGRLRLPEVLMRVLLDPSALRLLRWPMPDAIEGLRVEPGRLVIQSAS